MEPRPAKSKPPRAAGGRRASKAAKRQTLRDRLLRRLDDLAVDVPYAEQLAARLRDGCDETTLGDVIIDVMCMQALKGNPAILRALWERSDGRPTAPAAGQNTGSYVHSPLAMPLTPAKRRRGRRAAAGQEAPPASGPASEAD